MDTIRDSLGARDDDRGKAIVIGGRAGEGSR
jgi:hypothetical protein